MKKLIFCIVVVLFVTSPCLGNEGIHKFQFVSDYIRSLKHLKMIEEETSAFNSQYRNNIQYRNATMTFLRRANSDLLTAKGMMSKYEKSENQIIKKATESILLIYDNLSNIQLETLKMFEELDNPEIIDSPEKFNIESFMGRLSELQLKHDEFLKAFNDTSIMVTYVLVSWEPDENGHLSYLAISQRQRESLIKQIDEAFGDEKRSVTKEGQNSLNLCGAILRKVLVGGHKSSDGR
jgi:hypothetical protein